ncbi:hypothetical protein SELMODRAFT_103482 [Selaginella moellendorffii]|uniref:Fucosyltransferase n=1 Tax=Selaginella moellendorffii TaxID=88036 RepID=D8RXA3_SELML|nr:hypothetical protein SELMODRAFT_103482 [Selaginella moellendorffii]
MEWRIKIRKARSRLHWLLLLVLIAYLFIGHKLERGIGSRKWSHTQRRVPRKIKALVDLWSKVLERGHSSTNLPRALLPPHIQDCKRCEELHTKMDNRGKNGELPPWNLWKDLVHGSDDDNLPLTRLVQQDLWLHQHPKNCSNARFLLAHWHSQTAPIGVGSQMVFLSAILSSAVSEGRVFITLPFPGADHEGCTGSNHLRWSCYFAPEAAKECIHRALELYSDESAWKSGILKRSDNVFDPWAGVPNRHWGEPWKKMQPTEELDGNLIANTNETNERVWWRAQAYRYLLRFPSEYLCNLLNQARHRAFGVNAAEKVMLSITKDWQLNSSQPDDAKVWIPRPIVSVHVRQGDKSYEMTLHPLKDYMNLANALRRKFPELHSVWLSTEMQTVVDESDEFTDWEFYFTEVRRQYGTMHMTEYMESLGTKTAFDNSFVNLVMALEADFFVGALGSSWSYAINCLRLTGGKLKVGFLTVNINTVL